MMSGRNASWLLCLIFALAVPVLGARAQTVNVFSGTDSGVVQQTYTSSGGQIEEAENTGGAAGDGMTDDTSALQSVLSSGQTVQLGRDKTYRITSTLRITAARTGIRGAEGATLLMGSEIGEFDNSIANYRYHSNAVGIMAVGIEAPFVEGVRIVYEKNVDDRYVRAISFHSSTNISIKYNDISGFSKPLGIVYVGGTAGGTVSNNEIHSSYTNSATWGQITGIELDNDDPGSSDITISNNYIHDLTVGPNFLAAFNFQTDGINPTVRSRRLKIVDNVIENVGEGIDTFGSDGVITGNQIKDAYLFGIKMIHGASRNTVSENRIEKAGLAGIVISGSTSNYFDTADNYIANNTIIGINPYRKHPAKRTFGISMIYANTLSKIRRNRIIGNFIDLGGTGAIGITAKLGAGTDNEVRGNTIRNSAIRAYRVDLTVVPYFFR